MVHLLAHAEALINGCDWDHVTIHIQPKMKQKLRSSHWSWRQTVFAMYFLEWKKSTETKIEKPRLAIYFDLLSADKRPSSLVVCTLRTVLYIDNPRPQAHMAFYTSHITEVGNYPYMENCSFTSSNVHTTYYSAYPEQYVCDTHGTKLCGR